MAEETTVTINDDYASKESMTNEVFYNEVLYLPLNQLDLSDTANMETIIKGSKELIPTLKTEEERQALKNQVERIEGMIKNNSELKDVVISNMSWQDHDNDKKEDHPYDGMQAAVFTKGNEINVVYRGTPDRSWIDNAEMEIGTSDYSKCYVDKYGNTYNYLSPMQIEAMEYMDKLLKEYGDEWADKIITVGGHSKGDSLAALAMILNGDQIDRCFGIDGPGVSPETYKELVKAIGIERIQELQKYMFKLNEENDYVSPFGKSLYSDNNTRWCEGYYDPKSIMSAHYIGSIYNLKTGELAPFRSGPGEVWKFVREAYLEIEKLPPQLRKPACYAVMSFLQYGVNKKPPIWKKDNFKNKLNQQMTVALLDIISVLGRTFEKEEGREMLAYCKEIGLEIEIDIMEMKNIDDVVEAISFWQKILEGPRVIADYSTALNENLYNSFQYKSYKTGKATISYSEVDGLITKLDFYIEEVERRYINPATDAKDTLSTITEAGSSKSSFNKVIQNYKNIKTGLETYKDLLNQYKACCQETEDRFIKNLQGTATA